MNPRSTNELTRRSFLRILGTGTMLSAAGCKLVGPDSGVITPAALQEQWATAPTGQRILVVVELNGGNDGLTTLVPHGNGIYRDRRPGLAVDNADVIDLDGRLGINRAFADLHARGLGVLAGVGTPGNTLSHFQMLDRWWSGDPEGVGDYATGFLGRCCDAIGGNEPLTGVSLGWTPTPTLLSRQARTASLPDLESASTLFSGDNGLLRQLLPLAADGRGDQPSPLFEPARRSMRDALVLSDFLTTLAAPSIGYPETDLGLRLAAASRLIRSDRGIKIVHVPAGHDFDTHDAQVDDLGPALDDLNRSIETFLDDMDRSGFGNRVLVATTSEFGRRVQENDSGTDHGNASVALVAGAGVNPGVHGTQPPLDSLDADDNLATQVSFGDYYATLAERWLGVPRSDVLPPGTSTIPELLPA